MCFTSLRFTIAFVRRFEMQAQASFFFAPETFGRTCTVCVET
jgi:hypothetical protein